MQQLNLGKLIVSINAIKKTVKSKTKKIYFYFNKLIEFFL